MSKLDMSSRRIDTPSKGAVAKVQIMPLLRKTSGDCSPLTSIDLSRPSFEQEGLGIHYNEKDSTSNQVFTNYPTRRKLSELHRRSTSGNSQFSTTSGSSMSKPGAQNIHPMRLAPRAYTPPLSHSCQGSYFESDDSTKGEAAEGEFLAQSGTDLIDPSARVSSGQSPRLSLQIQNGSFTRLPGASQTNITSRSSFGYSRDNGSTLDTASPISRTSLDFVFRSKTRTSMDPISRAATVQAARQAFEEKEAAKTRKFEEQQMKAEEKQMKRREKQDLRASLKDDEIQEKFRENDSSKIADTHEKPGRSPSASQSGANSENWKGQPKNTWVLFLTWLRTRLFKFRRRVRSLG